MQVNIDLQAKATAINKNNNEHQQSNTITGDDSKYHPVTSWNNAKEIGFNMIEQQSSVNNLHTENISII